MTTAARDLRHSRHQDQLEVRHELLFELQPLPQPQPPPGPGKYCQLFAQ